MINCSRCGAAVNESDRVCPTCGKILEPSAPQSGGRQQENSRQPYPQQDYTEIPEPRFGLRWFRFLTRFGMWADAGITAILAIVMITGFGREEGLAPYYAAAPEFGTINLVFGILLLPVAAFGVLTALRLLRFRASAPKQLLLLCFIRAFVSLSLLGAILIIINNHDDLALRFGVVRDALLPTVLAGISFPINWIYFKTRESFFRN